MNEIKDYLELPLKELLADIGQRTPVPGGGSVAAAVGALGASLARMAVAYTVGKPAYAEHDELLRPVLDELQQASDSFAALMAQDMAAYQAYADARKGSADEQQQAVAQAIAVPIRIIELAGSIAARLDEIKSFTNPHLFSDLQAAAVLVSAAADAAATSARVNLSSVADLSQADQLADEIDRFLTQLASHRDAVMRHNPSS